MTSNAPFSPVPCPRDIQALVDGTLHTGPVLFLSDAVKINDHYQPQKRIIVITAKTFYNIKKSFWGWYSVQRCFCVSTITGLIRNPCVQEFVLKLSLSQPNDYRYQGDCIERLTVALLQLKPSLQVWTLVMDLDIYVRRKRDQSSSSLLTLSPPSPSP